MDIFIRKFKYWTLKHSLCVTLVCCSLVTIVNYYRTENISNSLRGVGSWTLHKINTGLDNVSYTTRNYDVIAVSANWTPGNRLEEIIGSMVIRNSVDNSQQVPKIDLRSYNKEQSFFKVRRPINIVNCKSIFDRNATEINRAERLAKGYSRNLTTAPEYLTMAENCEKFIKERGYITDSLTEEEQRFPIAYSILMYKTIEQTERLLRAIYRPQNIYCVHVDAKANPSVFQAVLKITRCFDNVFASSRVNVTWGTFSVLVPELICMQEVLKRSDKWKYFINLTGQELPLKTNAEIVRILKAYNGSNDIESFITWDSDQIRRLKDVDVPPHGAVPMKGSVHVAVSRDFVNYVLYDQKANDILNWVSRAKFSEELFFATLQGNPELGVPNGYIVAGRSPNIQKAARHKVWRGEKECHGEYKRDICIFGIRDLPDMQDRFELFANKFRMHLNSLVYDCVEELLFNRTRDQYFGHFNFDSSRYKDGGYDIPD